MSRLVTFLPFIVALCGMAASGVVAQPPREQIELTNHARYSGLIESEDSDWLTLIRIQTPPGRPMHLVIQPFEREQVLSGFQQCRLAAAFEERLNCRAGLLGAAAGAPLCGGHESSSITGRRTGLRPVLLMRGASVSFYGSVRVEGIFVRPGISPRGRMT